MTELGPRPLFLHQEKESSVNPQSLSQAYIQWKKNGIWIDHTCEIKVIKSRWWRERQEIGTLQTIIFEHMQERDLFHISSQHSKEIWVSRYKVPIIKDWRILPKTVFFRPLRSKCPKKFLTLLESTCLQFNFLAIMPLYITVSQGIKNKAFLMTTFAFYRVLGLQ